MSRERPYPPPTRDLDDPEEIAEMVRRFYSDVAQDDLLGPMFNNVARVDWSEHLPKLTDYWCRFLLGRPGYSGNPLRAHQLIHERSAFTDRHFERWLELFFETVDLGWTGPSADKARAFAVRVAAAHRRQLDVGKRRFGSAPVRPPLRGREGSDQSAVSHVGDEARQW